MMDKALTAIVAAAALATAAVIGVVAASFALFAGFSVLVGTAGAAAMVAVAALLAILIALFVMRGRPALPHRREAPQADDASLVQKAFEMAKEHPLLAVGAAVGAGIYAIRNPQLLAAVVTAFMAGRDEGK